MLIRQNSLLKESYNEYNTISISELNNIDIIPIIQIQESNVVNYKDIDEFCDNNGIYLEDVIDIIIKRNKLDNLTLCVEEYELIKDPYISEIYPNIVIKLLSENDSVSQFVDECVDMFLESDNDEYINIDNMIDILNEKFQWSANGGIKPKNKDFGLNVSLKDKEELWDKDKKLEGKRVEYSVWSPGAKEGDKWQVTTLGSTVGKEYVGALKLLRNLTDKPRDFIAKTAARLREKYRMWLQKANQEHDVDKQKWYKQIARKIMQAVDWCMKKLENMHSSREDRAKDAARDWHRKVKRYRYGMVGPKSVISYSIDGKPMNVGYKNKEDLDNMIK